MSRTRLAVGIGIDVAVAFCLFTFAYFSFRAVPAASASVFASPAPATSSTAEPRQYPVMDKIADKLIAKYQTATCEEKTQKAQPKSQEQQEAIPQQSGGTHRRQDVRMRHDSMRVTGDDGKLASISSLISRKGRVAPERDPCS